MITDAVIIRLNMKPRNPTTISANVHTLHLF